MSKKEIWVPIKGYEKEYKISNKGRIKSNTRILNTGWGKNERIGKIRKLGVSKQTGVRYINLCKNSQYKPFVVHRLVAKHFVPRPKGKDFVIHKDGDVTNNKADNLVWKDMYEFTDVKKIYQYDRKFNFIREWKSATDIVAAHPTYNKSGIYSCCTGSTKRYKNNIFSYKRLSDEEIHNLKIEYGFVCRYNQKGELLNTYCNCAVAAKKSNRYLRSRILEVCQHGGKHAGYYWAFYGDTLNIVSNKVYQYNKMGKHIKTYPSLDKLVKETGFNKYPIIKCCEGKKKTYKNFKWSYKDERPTKIFQMTKRGALLKVYSSIKELIEKTEFNKYSVQRCLDGKAKSYSGYKWSHNPPKI